jgi:maleate isomerase
MHERDYGRLARIGILTPQSNPTVEPELGLLLPPGVSMHVARCTSRGTPRQRFHDYFEQLDQTLERYDGLRLDAAGFACTASSYLIDNAHEQRRCEQLRQRFGYPVVTAAASIEDALRHLGAHRILLACPYPDWLLYEAEAHWARRGFDIAVAVSVQPEMQDTRAIYRIRHEEIAARVRSALAGIKADAIVITGTGMPGLRLTCELQDAAGLPAVNSNLCLAWACLRAAGADPGPRAPDPGFPLLGGWREGLASL